MSLLLPPSSHRPSYRGEVLRDNPTRYYPLGYPDDGTTVYNIGTDTGNHGAYVNTPPAYLQKTLSRDVGWGGSSLFTGQSSSEIIQANVISGLALPVTLECWFSPTDISNIGAIVHTNRDGTNYRGITIETVASGNIQIRHGDGSGATTADRRVFYTTNDPMSNGGVYHLVAVSTAYNATTLYINGVLQTLSTTGTSSALSLSGGNGFRIAGTLTNIGAPKGYISDVACWNGVALSANRIMAHYLAGKM